MLGNFVKLKGIKIHCRVTATHRTCISCGRSFITIVSAEYGGLCLLMGQQHPWRLPYHNYCSETEAGSDNLSSVTVATSLGTAVLLHSHIPEVQPLYITEALTQFIISMLLCYAL
jgi:hypothetical protein